jgi:hypothetical protein
MKQKIVLMLFMTGVTLAMALTAGWLMQGCAGKIPPLPTMVLTATPTP